LVAILRSSVPAAFQAGTIVGRRDCGRLGSCTESCQQMTAAGARGGDGIGLLSLIDGGDLCWRSNTQALDVRAFSSSSKPWARDTDGAIEGRLISHLSETACVDAHCILAKE
jgi:hypothetical protein